MQPFMKHLWASAQLDGRYQLGAERLRDGDRYDPFGVLCDLHDPEQWAFNQDGHYTYQGREHGVPPKLARRYELDAAHCDRLKDMTYADRSVEELAEFILANF